MSLVDMAMMERSATTFDSTRGAQAGSALESGMKPKVVYILGRRDGLELSLFQPVAVLRPRSRVGELASGRS